MNNITSVPYIERLDFFNGQRLFAEDLQTLDGFNRQMRWLHNRSLHAFGIGSGFFIVRGERGDREMTIAPGYAIDNNGREIILLLPRTVTVPPVADDGSGNPQFYDLAVHYPGIEDLEELETRTGIYGTHGAVRRREEPVFCWIELKADFTPKIDRHAQQIASGEKIVLARISVKNCRLETVSIATRRNVRPERLPYVTCGISQADDSHWEEWREEVTIGLMEGQEKIKFFLGVKKIVSTASAKFVSVPRYTARAVGERLFLNKGPNLDQNFLIEGFSMIDSNATPNQFTFRLFLPDFHVHDTLPVNPRQDIFQIVDEINSAGWYVEWMGVEG